SAHQQLLGHPHLIVTLGKFLCEDVQIGVFAEVGRHTDHVRPGARQFSERVAEWRGACDLAFARNRRDHCRGLQARLLFDGTHACLPASRASSASCHSCASTRMKWFFSRASRKGTPQPIFVSQTMMRGCGLSCRRALSNARFTASMSLPSTRCVYQPNASSLSTSGSN